MKRINSSLLLATSTLSIFLVSTHFANPPAPTLYIAAGGCLVVVIIGIIQKYKQAVGFSVSEILAGGFLFFAVVNGVFISGSFNQEWILSGFSLFLFYLVIKRTELTIEWLFAGLVFTGMAQAVYGLGQYMHWWQNIAAPSFRISGSFDNPAGFAAALVACFPFALHIVREQKWFLKLLGIVSASVIIAGIVLAQSRAGILALVVISATWLVGLLPAKWRQRCKQRAVVGVFAIVVALLIGSLYVWKKDSADGRLLIWQCSARMIADKPLLGHGAGGGLREYMLYQADYFRHHPGSKYMQLADIVKHPFNEYLLLWVEQGIVGVLLLVVIGWLVIRTYRRNRDRTENRVFMLCLLGVAVFACFSYPLNYPFVRLMLVFSVAMIMRHEPEHFRVPASVVSVLKPVALVVLVGMIALTGKMFYNEYYWNSIARRSLAGETRKVLPEYARLYPWMRGEGLFLYNYAAELNYIGEWKLSNRLMTECSQLYNDNDVQLTLADNCQQQKQYAQAEQHLKLAYEMVPNRFIPLYCLVQLYRLQGRDAEARKLAKQIIDKPVKIPSYDIVEIKKEMKEIITRKQ